MAFSFSALGTVGSACEPDGHPGFEFGRITFGIEAQAQRVAVVIADSALGLPGGKDPERPQFGVFRM
jgi:hypothetical protein